MYLAYFAAQFGGEVQVVDQVTLVGQRNAVGGFPVALHVKHDERRVEVGRHAGRLADHAARTFLRGVDDGQQFVVTELVARGDLVLDLFLHAQGHLLECQFAQLQDIVLREEVVERRCDLVGALISPEELRVPDYIINDVLEANGIEYKETRSLEEVMPELDILYMTRVQKERFFNEEDYIRLKNSYVLTKEKMGLAKPDMAVLHPLPRVNEIALDVDDDPRAAYFEQVQNGVYVRMALIMTLLGLHDPKAKEEN